MNWFFTLILRWLITAAKSNNFLVNCCITLGYEACAAICQYTICKPTSLQVNQALIGRAVNKLSFSIFIFHIS